MSAAAAVVVVIIILAILKVFLDELFKRGNLVHRLRTDVRR